MSFLGFASHPEMLSRWWLQLSWLRSLQPGRYHDLYIRRQVCLWEKDFSLLRMRRRSYHSRQGLVFVVRRGYGLAWVIRVIKSFKVGNNDSIYRAFLWSHGRLSILKIDDSPSFDISSDEGMRDAFDGTKDELTWMWGDDGSIDHHIRSLWQSESWEIVFYLNGHSIGSRESEILFDRFATVYTVFCVKYFGHI